MKQYILQVITALILSSLILLTAADSALADTLDADVDHEANIDSIDQPQMAQQRKEEAVFQLSEIQQSLKSKLAERKNLQRSLSSAPESQKESIQGNLDSLNQEIELLEKTFEQIAIGGIDLSVFGVQDEKFDWREELITIVKPLLENVKSLTEKPRKIENLRRVIDEKKLAQETSQQAVASITQLLEEAESDLVKDGLHSSLSDWQGRFNDLKREIQLAEYQLDSLQGKDVPWLDILQGAFADFVEGRGLTLLFIVFAILAVLGITRGLLWLVRKRVSDQQDNSQKTHYRLAAYGYRLLTAVLIAVAVMMVLYFRQDLLLLAIMVVVLIGFALALKNLLPKYITEGRILLNIGGIRERERVIYKGIPWQVSALNVHSRLVNPEIRGGIRLPIGHMHEMLSRPSNDEDWFPSSEGDWILGDDGNPEQVVKQTVDVVELRDLNAISHTVPTAEYYERGFPNITRADVFRIAVSFGIDYATQKEDPATVERAFADGIKAAFKGTEYEKYVLDVGADFESAGNSSLNYLMLAKFDSAAAQYYNRIKRRMQRACVKICSKQGWGIPFPQITVHRGGSASADTTPSNDNSKTQEQSNA